MTQGATDLYPLVRGAVGLLLPAKLGKRATESDKPVRLFVKLSTDLTSITGVERLNSAVDFIALPLSELRSCHIGAVPSFSIYEPWLVLSLASSASSGRRTIHIQLTDPQVVVRWVLGLQSFGLQSGRELVPGPAKGKVWTRGSLLLKIFRLKMRHKVHDPEPL
jgi:hypothetical protein